MNRENNLTLNASRRHRVLQMISVRGADVEVTDEDCGDRRGANDALGGNRVTRPVGDGCKRGNRLRNLHKRVVEGKYLALAGEAAKRINRWAGFGSERFHARPETHTPQEVYSFAIRHLHRSPLGTPNP